MQEHYIPIYINFVVRKPHRKTAKKENECFLWKSIWRVENLWACCRICCCYLLSAEFLWTGLLARETTQAAQLEVKSLKSQNAFSSQQQQRWWSELISWIYYYSEPEQTPRKQKEKKSLTLPKARNAGGKWTERCIFNIFIKIFMKYE